MRWRELPAIASVSFGQFRFQVGLVTAPTPVTLTGSLNGSSATVSFTVQPPVLKSINVFSPITEGTQTSLTVMLTGAAPPGGAAVSLASSSPAASPPATATVAAGSQSVTVTVPTSAVTSTTAMTISASRNGTTVQTQLTINPAPTGPLPAPTLLSPASDARFSPGQTVPFDWSDVSGAASYEIQLIAANDFSSLAVDQSVTASQFATSTLSSSNYYWRVRAKDSSGSPGAWSTVWRVTVN